MRNTNLLIAGATGSGKSTLTRELINLSARVIVLDPMDEYEGEMVALDFDEAGRYFIDRRWKPFSLVLRMGQEEQYAMLELAFHTQLVEAHGPLVVVMEEATEHSSTWDMEDTPHKLYVKGRHARISSITVVQQDTDINRITKHSAAAVIAFQQNYLSTTWERFFKWEEVQNLVSLSEDYGKPHKVPVQGHHFIVRPQQIEDIYEWWWERHGYIAKLR